MRIAAGIASLIAAFSLADALAPLAITVAANLTAFTSLAEATTSTATTATQTDMQADTATPGASNAWDESVAPNYYAVDGPAVIPSDMPIKNVSYAGVNAAGQVGAVTSRVTHAAMVSGSQRERDDMLDPAGWDDNEKVSIELVGGRVYHGYLFNRSHLLAKSLGGTETLANLITATRTQNVGSNNAGGTGMGGMAYTEQLARLPRRPSGWLRRLRGNVHLHQRDRSAGVFVVACWFAAAIDLRAIAHVRGSLD